MSLLLFGLLFVFVIVLVLFINILLRRIYPVKCPECEKRKQSDQWQEAVRKAPKAKRDEESDVE